MRELTCDSNVEVIGKNILSILVNLHADDIQPFAAKHGLEDIQPEEWYSLSKWLDFMNDLAQNTGFTLNFVAIGMGIAENVNLPPEMENATYSDILLSWDHIYHHQHRGGEIGNHYVEKITDTHFKCTFTDVYPDDLKYGIAYGFARRFLPKGTSFVIKYEDMNQRMDKGNADQTVMFISWS